MKRACYRRRRAKLGAFGLVELIIVVVIILGGVLLYMNMSAGARKAQQEAQQETQTTNNPAPLVAPSSLPGKALRKAVSFECQNNLRQLRMAIDMAKNTDNKAPESLSAMPEAAKISSCPVSKQPYEYNPATGKVHCTCPGHEEY